MAAVPRTESVTVGDGTFDLHVVTPDGGGRSLPGILLLQEIFGVNDFLLGKAADLADLGYVVGCPDVFWRVERNVSLPHDEESLGRAFGYMERFGAIDMAVTTADLLAALDAVRRLPEVGDAVGVMGYCLGGRLAYEVAVGGDPTTCVSYYGSGVADRLDDAGRVTCPVLFHFGGNDPFIPNEQADAVAAAFAGRDDAEVLVQPEAGHAFENLLAPAFGDPAAAARSWPVTVAFLQRTLGQPGA
jgi:carboxymethylenebutenolidase